MEDENALLRTNLQLLTDHYQKTYELNYEYWKERNRMVLILLAVIGVGTLLTYQISGSETLFLSFIVHTFSIDTKITPIDQLQKEFPFAIFQLVLLVVILYMMINVYQRTVFILRNIWYMADIEEEIRACLHLSGEKVAFSREGAYYVDYQTLLQRWGIWLGYVVTLGGLLIAFLAKRIIDDLAINNPLLVLGEIVISAFILIFFLSYAFYRPTKKTKKKKEQS